MHDKDQFEKQISRSMRLATLGAIVWIVFLMCAIGFGLYIAGRALEVF